MFQAHHFIFFNCKNGLWKTPLSKRTAENIANLKGKIIPDTAEEIDPTLLNVQGRYVPPVRIKQRYQ